MLKFALFDVDGVVIAKREKYFNQRLSEEYGVPDDLIKPLFKNEFYKCIVGEMDLKDVLENYVEQWGWKGTVDDLLRYWWSGEEKINQDVINIIESFRRQGVRCYLASDQEKNRMGYLMSGLNLQEHFDGVFFSCNLGVQKTEPKFWLKVLAELGNPSPKEVTYWDDEEENVVVARKMGINAIFFQGISDLNALGK